MCRLAGQAFAFPPSKMTGQNFLIGLGCIRQRFKHAISVRRGGYQLADFRMCEVAIYNRVKKIQKRFPV